MCFRLKRLFLVRDFPTCIYVYVFFNDGFPVMNTVLVSYMVMPRNMVSSKHVGNAVQFLEFGECLERYSFGMYTIFNFNALFGCYILVIVVLCLIMDAAQVQAIKWFLSYNCCRAKRLKSHKFSPVLLTEAKL